MLTLLQMGLPGGPELLIVIIILLVPGALVGRWVYRDAKRRGSAWAW